MDRRKMILKSLSLKYMTVKDLINWHAHSFEPLIRHATDEAQKSNSAATIFKFCFSVIMKREGAKGRKGQKAGYKVLVLTRSSRVY